MCHRIQSRTYPAFAAFVAFVAVLLVLHDVLVLAGPTSMSMGGRAIIGWLKCK